MFDMSMGFGWFGILFAAAFIMIFAVIAVIAVSGLFRWNKNNNSPRLTVDAKVVAKRENVSHHVHAGNDFASHTSYTSTYYYVTFEFDFGRPHRVSGSECGIWHACGRRRRKARIPGTRFLSFDRNRV